ncbi:MAG: DUF4430 domain-containing protein [Ruminococcaceae bacterium]|nr:DUF4430 domain-containing protein [Oscillospiraceae bacterium]
MKKTSIVIIALLIVVAIGVFFFQGENATDSEKVMESAETTESTVLGNGKNTLYLSVVVGDKVIDFTIKTDTNNVGEALKEVKLIEGEEGPYGIYIKKVNGIEADYDKDQSYWSFEKDGEAMQTGVDSTEFKDGEHFQLVYTK